MNLEDLITVKSWFKGTNGILDLSLNKERLLNEVSLKYGTIKNITYNKYVQYCPISYRTYKGHILVSFYEWSQLETNGRISGKKLEVRLPNIYV